MNIKKLSFQDVLFIINILSFIVSYLVKQDVIILTIFAILFILNLIIAIISFNKLGTYGPPLERSINIIKLQKFGKNLFFLIVCTIFVLIIR